MALCCLFYWPAQLVCSQQILAGVGCCDAVMGGREVRRGWSVGSTGYVGERSLQLVFCCDVRDETEGLGLGEERQRGEGLQAAYMVFWP